MQPVINGLICCYTDGYDVLEVSKCQNLASLNSLFHSRKKQKNEKEQKE
jgi:hypothetical protein